MCVFFCILSEVLKFDYTQFHSRRITHEAKLKKVSTVFYRNTSQSYDMRSYRDACSNICQPTRAGKPQIFD